MKLKTIKKFSAIFLSVCLVVCSLSCGFVFLAKTTAPEAVEAASYDEYYADLDESLTGLEFRAELAELITETHDYNPSYDGLRNIFDESDADPNKPGNILWFYTGTSVSFSGSFSTGTNREHVWPKNAGNAFPETSGPGSDAHHLRPTNDNLNSSRGNNNFGEVPQTTANIVGEEGSKSYANPCYQQNSVFYPGKGYRGATARILMYVQTRWGDQHNLSFVLGKGSNKTIGDIEDLMKWHLEEPPTQEEKVRNEVVYGIQGNRNPFIDHPEYAEMIYCYDGKNYNDELQNAVETYGSYLDDVGGDSTITLEGLTLSSTSVNLAVGENHKFTVSAVPSGASRSVTWTSSNPSVATVSSGVVKALASGTTTITATSTKNTAIKVSATVKVKAVSSIEVEGTPVKATYSSGEVFNPAGLTVTTTYTDGSTAVIANSDCEWLDGTSKTEELQEGSTSIICKYQGKEDVINGITVKKSTTQSITITRDSFVENSGYTWGTWNVSGYSGQGFIYHGTAQYQQNDFIQMNSNKTAQYIYNTTPFTGGIVSITIKSTTSREWQVLTKSTPFATGSGKATGGTNRGTFTTDTAGAKLNIGTSDQYFAINLASASGAAYIEELIITFGASHAHTPGDWIIDEEATCKEVGSKHNECTECGEIVEVVEIPTIGHEYGIWTETKAPTCTEPGEEETMCATCKEMQTREIESLGHDLEKRENSYEAPTCDSEGCEFLYECIRCDYVEAGTIIPATGHDYGAWVVITPSTCSQEGCKERVCSTCGEAETEAMETIAHAYGEWVKVDGGMEEHTCAECGHKEQREQANLEKVENFEKLVEEVTKAGTLDAKWKAIGSAIEGYNNLSDSEKEVAQEIYARLGEEITAYNTAVTEINVEADKANEMALLFFAGTISILAVAAYFLLKA